MIIELDQMFIMLVVVEEEVRLTVQAEMVVEDRATRLEQLAQAAVVVVVILILEDQELR
jgi:hypothetical protein